VDITAGNGKIYVVNYGSNTTSVINGSTNTKERDISVGSNPVRIAYDSDTNMIYVAKQRSGSVSVIPHGQVPPIVTNFSLRFCRNMSSLLTTPTSLC
jgi:YVTN family beta-propeller protein